MRTKIAALSVLLAVSAYGQKAPASKTPDQLFADLNALAAPAPLAKTINGDKKTRDQLTTEIAAQANAANQAAQLAKIFYTDNPNHPKAVEAQKIEALSSVHGAQAGDPVQAQVALALAKIYRERTDIPAKDRFEVALAADRFALSAKIKAKKAADQPVEWQLVGERLRLEFGDLPELYDYSVEVARRSDFSSAVQIATEVARSPKATTKAKERAQAILDRAALVGRPVNLKLAKIDGGTVDLAQQTDKITMVYVWSPTNPLGLDSVKRFEKALSQGVQLIYLAFGGSVPLVNRLKDSAAVKGVHCHAGAGVASKAANDALRLTYSDLPAIYAINRSGILTGVGRVEEFTAIMATASK